MERENPSNIVPEEDQGTQQRSKGRSLRRRAKDATTEATGTTAYFPEGHRVNRGRIPPPSDPLTKDIKDKASGQFRSIEEKVFKSAEGYKNASNVRSLVAGEVEANGLTGDDADAVISQVMTRLKRTEKLKTRGSKFGKANDPNKQMGRLASLIKSLRY